MALLRKSKSQSLSEDELDKTGNNNNNLKWKGPGKETVSSRLRREMNAGKGIRTRSRTSGSQEDLSNTSSWAKEKLMEQKRTIKENEDEIEELKKTNKTLQENVRTSDAKINDLTQTGTTKDGKIKDLTNERQTLVKQTEDFKNIIASLQQKSSQLQSSLEVKEKTLDLCQKNAENKEKKLSGLHNALESGQNEKASIITQYNEKLNDYVELNKTLQREIELLKNELDNQLEKSSTLKQDLEKQLQSANEKCDTLSTETEKFGEACHKYEEEISERIRENLHIMEDYDNAKIVEHKQLNFINELTLSNQDLINSVRKLHAEIEELRNKLADAETENAKVKDDTKKSANGLENEQNKNTELETKIKDYSKRMGEQGQTIQQLTNETERLKKTIDDIKQHLTDITNSRDEYVQKCDQLQEELNKKSMKFHGDSETFMKRDQEQTVFLNQLVNDFEKMKECLDEKTELADKSKAELTKLQETAQSDKDSHLETIDALGKQVHELTNTVDLQTGNINKLQMENAEVTKKLIEGIETIETLKVNNNNMKTNFQELTKRNEDLEKSVDDLTKICSKKDEECRAYQQQIEAFEESAENQGSLFADLNDQNEFLKAQLQDSESESTQLKMNLGSCVEKHNDEVAKIQDLHMKTVKNLNDEIAETRSRSQEEINELLNNFNEVENELSFCQDEMMNKTKELNSVRDQLTEFTNAAMNKEQKLIKDLETLNEQNENILHSEIRKCKLEYDEKVLALQEEHSAEMNKLRTESQAKLTSVKKEHESELTNQLSNVQSKMADELLMVSAEKESLQDKFDRKAIDYDRIRTNMDNKLKNKEVELTSKSRIIDQLGRRIETQQKLIDYMMKSLESERSKQNLGSTGVMQMLANLQSTIDDRLSPNMYAAEPLHYRTSLSSASSTQELAFGYYPQLPVNSSPKREILTSTGEPVISPIPSPSSSPITERPKDDFEYYLRSTGGENGRHSQTYPWIKEYDTKGSMIDDRDHGVDKFSKSLPLDTDQGYALARPSKNNTKTVYFGEQIQTIMKTFEKMEALHDDNSPDKELNMEIWKQKIHFRLKVLEDQMNEIDTVSNASSNTSVNNALHNTSMERLNQLSDTKQPNKVMFHPTTEEIRELIENVDRRYKKLGQKHLIENAKLH